LRSEYIELPGLRARPGTRQVVVLPVTQTKEGSPVNLYVHVLCGREPGPNLLLLSMLHGNEWFSTVQLRQLLAELDPAEMRGTLMVVPVANPVAFRTGTRVIVDDSDMPDLNRSFGGPFEWMTNQIARVIAEKLMKQADYMIDYHISDWGSAMNEVSYGEDFTDPATREKSRLLALAYAYPSVNAGSIASVFPGPASSRGYAGEVLHVPNIAVEIGGLGFGQAQEDAWTRATVDGAKNVMRHIGMLEGKVRRLDRYLVWRNRWRLSPTRGGYMEILARGELPFREVAKGEVMARIVDPRTFEVLEEMASPGRGIVFYFCRDYMVQPGQWAFGIVNMEDGRSGWVEGDRAWAGQF